MNLNNYNSNDYDYYGYNQNKNNLIPLFQINNIIENDEIENVEIEEEISQRRTVEALPNYYIDYKNLHKKNKLELPRLYNSKEIEYIINYESKFSDEVKKIKINDYIEKK